MNQKLKKIKEKKVKSKKEEDFVSTTEKLSKQITDVHAHNTQKIVKVSKDLEDFRKSVLSQLELANEGKATLKASYNFKDFLDFNGFMERKNILLKSEVVPQNTIRMTVPPRKFYASNKIESDYSNFEENEKLKGFEQKINTSVSKIEDKREENIQPIMITNNSDKNNKSNHIVEILHKIDENEKKEEVKVKKDDEEEKLANKISCFYEEFSKRDNDIYKTKLTHENYFPLKNIPSETQDDAIDPLINKNISKYNKMNIDFEDIAKLKKGKAY